MQSIHGCAYMPYLLGSKIQLHAYIRAYIQICANMPYGQVLDTKLKICKYARMCFAHLCYFLALLASQAYNSLNCKHIKDLQSKYASPPLRGMACKRFVTCRVTNRRFVCKHVSSKAHLCYLLALLAYKLRMCLAFTNKVSVRSKYQIKDLRSKY